MTSPLGVDPAYTPADELAQLRAVFEFAPVGLAVLDRELRYAHVNRMLAEINGLPAEAHLGRTVREIVPDLADAVEPPFRRALDSGDPVYGLELDGETAREPGVRGTWLVNVHPLWGASGIVRAVAIAVQDITERRRAEAEREQLVEQLTAERARLEAVLQYMPAGVFIAEAPSGRMVLSNAHAARIWRQPCPPAETIEEYRQYRGFHADGSSYEAHEWPLARTLATGEVVIGEEIGFLRGDDTRGTMLASSAPIRAAGGRVAAAVSIFEDITERKRAEERQRLLAAELAHRIKNALALVQAIAQQTAARVETVPAFIEAFEGRLRALGAAHTLLTADRWEAVSLDAVARAICAPYLDARVRLEVADLELRPSAALALALVFHELATNASKYGALSVPHGRVVVSARVASGEADDRLHLLWREEGGPSPGEPAKAGFGTTMLRRVVEYQHNGEVVFEWREEGLVCCLSLPLEGLTRPADPGRPAEGAQWDEAASARSKAPTTCASE